MTQRILSQAAMCELLSKLADGYLIREASASIGLTESGFDTWRRKSRIAFDECDFTTFYFTWGGRLDFFHCHVKRAMQPRREPLPPVPSKPPYARGLRTAAPTEPPAKPTEYRIDETISPFPPPVSEATPRVIKQRPESPLVRDLMARAAIKPSNPHPLDASGRRTMISTGGMRADDPPERVTTGR